MAQSKSSTLPDDPSRQEATARLSLDRAVLTRRTSLSLPARLPLEDWKRVGQQLSRISDSSTWWLGDWLIYGREHYPDRYKRAIDETLLDYQTLRNYAWVAGRFSPRRRRAGLSFQHHAEVAAFSEKVQDMWLDKAEEHNWSRNALRSHVRALHEQTREQENKFVRIRVDVATEHMKHWTEAASRTQRDLVDWMVQVLNDAAGSGVGQSAADSGEGAPTGSPP